MWNKMGYNSSISFGALTIEAATINPIKIIGTRKQKVGGRIVIKQIPDRTSTDWQLTINASFSDTNRNTDRDTLQTHFTSMNLVKYVDGLHDGDYYITSLRWLDSDQRPNEHRFTMIIIQEQ